MSTIFPVGIDTNIELPTVVDNLTPVKATAVNILRDAIIAVEAALGVMPQGVYSTVASRLNVLEAAIASGGGGGGSAVFGGDLATHTATTQTVVGLQNRPIASTAPTTGQALSWNGSQWAPGASSGATITQANWFIDPVSGNDTNNGSSSGTALRTWAGLLTKWGANPILSPTGGTMTITYLNSAPSSDPIRMIGVIVGADATVNIVANTTTTLFTGTVNTSLTVNRSSTPNTWEVNDLGVTTWTPETRLRITSGARAGNVLWVAADLGGHTAATSAPIISSTFLNAPTLGSISATDPYVAESLMQIYISDIEPQADSGVSISNYPIITFTDFTVSSSSDFEVNVGGNADIIFQNCLIAGDVSITNGSDDFGAVFLNCCFASGTSQRAIRSLGIYAGLVHDNLETSTADTFAGQIFLDADVLYYGSTLVPLGLLRIGLTGFFNAPADGISSGFGVYVANNVLGLHALYGSGNAQYGVDIPQNSWFFYQSTVPTVTGTSGDFRLAGATSARGWVEAISNYGPLTTCTWTNISTGYSSGGLGGNAHVLDANCHLVTTGSGSGLNFGFGPGHSLSGPWAGTIGSSNAVSATNATAFGVSNTVSGNESCAIGFLGTVTGNACFVAGAQCSAGGNPYAIAMGNMNISDGQASIALGEQCFATAEAAVAIGSSCSASNVEAVALGGGSQASGRAAFATGLFGIATNYGERCHNSQTNTKGYHDILIFGTDGSGAGVTLTQGDGTAFISLTDTSSYSIIVDVIGSRTDAQNNARWKYEIAAHTSAGQLVIDDILTVRNFPNGTTWTVAISAVASSTNLQIIGTGTAAQTVNFQAYVAWHQIGGF